MRKVKLIYNSIAGQSKFKYFLDTIVEKFTENEYDVSIFRANKKMTHQMEEYIKNSEGIYAIIVAGGDGTINKVVNIMKNNNINVPLGIIPAGTANDFATHVEMPSSFLKSIDKILNGTVQKIDLGLVNNKYFINVCSAGVCSNAAHTTDLKMKNKYGVISYIFTAMYELIKFKPFDVKIETKTDLYIEKINLFLAFNGSSAGTIKFLDSSSLQDGLLDIIIVKKCNMFKLGMLLFKLLSGKYPGGKLEDKDLIHLKENYIKISKIKGNCDDPAVDGDQGIEFPLEIKCEENSLSILL